MLEMFQYNWSWKPRGEIQNLIWHFFAGLEITWIYGLGSLTRSDPNISMTHLVLEKKLRAGWPIVVFILVREVLVCGSPGPWKRRPYRLVHDQNHHCGFHRAYARASEAIYIRYFSNRLRRYIHHCKQCFEKQTIRHAPYEKWASIKFMTLPFHTVIIDFIVALPPSETKLNVVLITLINSSKNHDDFKYDHLIDLWLNRFVAWFFSNKKMRIISNYTVRSRSKICCSFLKNHISSLKRYSAFHHDLSLLGREVDGPEGAPEEGAVLGQIIK